MNRQQYLLCKIAEECSEIQKIAMKAQQFGMDSRNPDTLESNSESLKKEWNDLYTIIVTLQNEFGIDLWFENEFIIEKEKKLSKYYEISKELGLVGESYDRN